MNNKIEKNIKKEMEKNIKNFIKEINKLNIKNNSLELFKKIKIKYYKKKISICKISNIFLKDFNVIQINVFDNKTCKKICKKVIKLNLGFNPIIGKNYIKINIPPLTEEKRIKIIKILKKQTENNKINIRNIRRKFNNLIKKYLKEKKINKDEEIYFLKKNLLITKKYIKKINILLYKKKKEILN